MEDLVLFALVNVPAIAGLALYLAVLRLWLGDGPAAITPASAGTVFVLTLAAILSAPLIGVARSADMGIVLAIACAMVQVIGGAILLETLLPTTLRATQPPGVILVFPILASIGAIPFGLFLRIIL
ncbi:MAG: hypothetical protein RML45_01530 [Acetobacteraceae bacterium]|nr:hypothetical protein [Acetobacteraceae bacterium]